MSALGKAMLAFQNDPPHIALDATNPHYHSKFASLPGVIAAVRPAMNKHGLVVTQLPTVTDDGAAALETRLIHAESGEEIASTMPLALEKPGPQGQASAITYARRIALLSMLGLVGDEDDDGNTAQPRNGDGHVQDPHGFAESRADNVPDDQIVIHFGKSSGKRLSELSPKQIEWYAQIWEPNPQYANDADRRLKAAAQTLHVGVPADAQPVDDTSEIPF